MFSFFAQFSYRHNRRFYKTLLKLAIPMGLTSLFGSLLNMIDTIMISSLGKEAIVAVGSSNKIFFFMNVALYGVFTGCGVFISQYWGKKDLKRLQTVYMSALIIGIIISSIIMIVSLFFSASIIDLFTDDPYIIQLGSIYLRTVCVSFVLSSIIFSIEMVSRSTENVTLPMVVSSIGVLLNTGLNYMLIFGHFGFNPMGVKGAAIATVIARIVQLVIYISFILITKNKILYLKFTHFVFDPTMFKRLKNRVIPVVLNESVWALGTVVISIAYSMKGTDAYASMQLFDTFVGLLTVFTWGVANSSAIMLGKRIGEKNFEEARQYGKMFIFTALTFGFLTSLVMVGSIPIIPFLYKSQIPIVIHYVQSLMLIMALYMPFKLLAATFIVGILRSGGDTIFAFIADVGLLWIFSVPMAFSLVHWTLLSLPIIYLIVSVEEPLKDIICFIRYKSGNYIHNLVH